MRHGLIYALSRLGAEQELTELSQHPSTSLRIAAVVALRRIRSAGLSEFLKDSDSLVLMETARAIHDDFSVPEAMPALAQSLAQVNLTNEVFVRRAINANLRIGDAESAKRLAEYSKNQAAPNAMRSDALWALGYWDKPPLLDRVDGRYRELTGRDLQDAQQAFASVSQELLDSKDPDIRIAAITAAGRLKYKSEEARLVALCLDKSEPVDVRRASLKSLAQLDSEQIQQVLKAALADKNLELRTDAQSLLGTMELPAESVVELLASVLGNSTVPERQQALASLARINHPAALALLGKWLERFVSGQVEVPVQLDLMLAVENSSSEELKNKLKEFEQNRASAPVLERYRETLMGGNPEEGRRLFLQDNSAQCIRCHILGEYGGEVGPDLTGIAGILSREQLLEAMIDPSARLAPGYGTVTVTTSDDEQLTGVLEYESADSLVIRTGDGNSRRLSQQLIQEKNYIPSSMPNMQQVLTKQEIRDLVAFLVMLK